MIHFVAEQTNLLLCSQEVSEDVWIYVMVFCDLRSLLSLEQTCKCIRSLSSSRVIWIMQLHELEQERAPDLYPGLVLDALNGAQLRCIVARAYRRHRNCSQAFSPVITRTTILSLTECESRTTPRALLGDLSEWGSEIVLLPGGSHLLILWPKGFLQCWDVVSQSCVWTYPSPPSGGQQLRILSFDSDVCGNGNLLLLVSTERTGSIGNSRTLEVFEVPMDKSLDEEHRQSRIDLASSYGKPDLIKIHAEIIVIHSKRSILVRHRTEGRQLIIDDIVLDDVKILDDHLVCLCDRFKSKSLVVIPLFDVVGAMGDTAEDHHFQLQDFAYVEYLVSHPMDWMINRASISVCSFDWKETVERGSFVVIILADVYSETYEFPVAYHFLVTTAEDGPPRIVPRGSTAYVHDYNTYTLISTPSRAGTTVIACYNDAARDGVNPNRMLITFSQTQVLARQIDPIYFQGTQAPATRSLFVEPYNGAVFYATANSETIVIYNFD